MSIQMQCLSACYIVFAGFLKRENKIKKLRQELGWSQKELADFLGCTIRTVQAWDAAYTKNYPTEWVEKLIIEKLGIELLKK